MTMLQGILTAVLSVLVLGVLYGIPIFLVRRLWKNGYRGWAWATGICALFALGLPVGLIGLAVNRKPVGRPSECPRCGEVNPAIGAVTLNRETGERHERPALGIALLVGGLALAFFPGWFAMSWLLDPPPVDIAPPCAALGAAAAIGSSMFAWGANVLRQAKVDRVRIIKYKCGVCAHQWQEGEKGAELTDDDWQRWSNKALERSIQGLKDANSKNRAIAAGTLAKTGDARAVEPLIEALEDGGLKHLYARMAAAEALGKLGDARAVEPLARALKDFPVPAAKALGEIGDARATEPLVQLLARNRRAVRRAAAQALAKAGDARAIEPLARALEDNDAGVQEAAREALQRIRVRGE